MFLKHFLCKVSTKYDNINHNFVLSCKSSY